jgi:hypothetical protein
MMSELRDDSRVLFRVGYPRWFLLFWGVCVALVMVLSISVIAHDGLAAITLGKLFKWGALCLLLGLGLAMSTLICRSIVVTESGIRYRSMIGRTREFAWHEIGGLTRPVRGIPEDAAYIALKNGKYIHVLRSMRGYAKFASLIHEKIPGQAVDTDLEESKTSQLVSWNTIWVAIAVGVIYVLLRRALG